MPIPISNIPHFKDDRLFLGISNIDASTPFSIKASRSFLLIKRYTIPYTIAKNEIGIKNSFCISEVFLVGFSVF